MYINNPFVRKHTHMLKDVIHQRGCLSRSCDLGNGCGWGMKRKSHKIKKAFTQILMLVSLRGRSVINSTLWEQRWYLPWDVETKGKGGYVKREGAPGWREWHHRIPSGDAQNETHWGWREQADSTVYKSQCSLCSGHTISWWESHMCV